LVHPASVADKTEARIEDVAMARQRLGEAFMVAPQGQRYLERAIRDAPLWWKAAEGLEIRIGEWIGSPTAITC
jgi:hypothetical protein